MKLTQGAIKLDVCRISAHPDTPGGSGPQPSTPNRPTAMQPGHPTPAHRSSSDRPMVPTERPVPTQAGVRRWWHSWRGAPAGHAGVAATGLSGAIDPGPSGDGHEESDPVGLAHRNYLRRLRESGL